MRSMRKKTKKFRGKRTFGTGHGWRGAGNRGGRGRAGGCKHHFKEGGFGKHGFKRPPKVVEEKAAINVGELDQISEYLLAEGMAKEKKGAIHIDLADLGIAKVLGSGQVTKKFVLRANEFSETAKMKLEKMGGKAIGS